MSKRETTSGYIIISDEGYWNNSQGWCGDVSSATRFSTMDFSLPVGTNVQWAMLVNPREVRDARWLAESYCDGDCDCRGTHDLKGRI